MVATLELLRSGVYTVNREFEDGSCAWFRATASPSVLRSMGLDETKIYNLDAQTIVPEELVNEEKLNIVDREDLMEFSELDRYLNGGVKGECFKP